MDTIRNAEQLIQSARSFSGNNTVAVAMANDASVLQAVHQATEEGIVNAVLIGDRSEMLRIAEEGKFSLNGNHIEDVPDPVAVLTNPFIRNWASPDCTIPTA